MLYKNKNFYIKQEEQQTYKKEWLNIIVEEKKMLN